MNKNFISLFSIFIIMNVNCDARNMEVELFCNNISFKCSALNQNKCVGKIGKQTQDS